MSSSNHNLFLFSLIISIYFSLVSLKSQAQIPPPTALALPIIKDPTSLQYYTTLEISNSGSQVNLVLDLAGQQLWFYCPSFNLPSYNPITCDSPKCEALGDGGCTGCNRPPMPGCTNNTCAKGDYSPFSDLFVGEGLGEDFLSLPSTDGQRVLRKVKSPYPLTLSCSDYLPLYEGLATQAKGLVGLSKSKLGLPTLLANAFKLSLKFSLCINPSPSKIGSIIIGGGPYYLPPTSTTDLSKSLTTTTLVINPNSTAPSYHEGEPSEEYFLDVKSITIDDEPVSFKPSLLSFDSNGFGGTKLSTTAPYTALHTNIYKPFVRAFEKAASNRKMKKVEDVAPFGACFDSNTVGNTALTGPDVPVISLVLAGGGGGKKAEWTIYGANSIVEVTKGVSCLAFVDGGQDKYPGPAVLLGGKQLENYFLEIDIAESKLGFTSLLLQGTTCSYPPVQASSSSWAI